MFMIKVHQKSTGQNHKASVFKTEAGRDVSQSAFYSRTPVKKLERK
jgi:hypothetical protein